MNYGDVDSPKERGLMANAQAPAAKSALATFGPPSLSTPSAPAKGVVPMERPLSMLGSFAGLAAAPARAARAAATNRAATAQQAAATNAITQAARQAPATGFYTGALPSAAFSAPAFDSYGGKSFSDSVGDGVTYGQLLDYYGGPLGAPDPWGNTLPSNVSIDRGYYNQDGTVNYGADVGGGVSYGGLMDYYSSDPGTTSPWGY